MLINACTLEYKELNEQLHQLSAKEEALISNCCGQRFIAAGMSERVIRIQGTPGNALGAYLDGAVITVEGNAQDAVGDTMNDGKIVIHGNIGDTAGYAMRGGRIYVQGNAGYRSGVHMKEYREHLPVLIIGGSAGSFLGEYQAGGRILVLGLNQKGPLVGNFPCTGMHGGKVIFRGEVSPSLFPPNVRIAPADADDMQEIREYLSEFAEIFSYSLEELLDSPFTVAVPDSKNPYKQMYVMN